MEEDQVLDEYEVAKDNLDEKLNDYDFNQTHLEDLEDIDNGIEENISQESLDVLTIPVTRLYKQLGLNIDVVSKESLSDVVKTGWERFVELIKKVVQAVNGFIKSIINYIKKIFFKKGEKQKEDLKDVKNPTRTEILNDTDSSHVVLYLMKKYKNTSTSKIDGDYIASSLAVMESFYSALINPMISDASFNDLTVEEYAYKKLDLDVYTSKNFPMGYVLRKDITINNRHFLYFLEKISDEKSDLKEVTSITTLSKSQVNNFLEWINLLDKYMDKASRITNMMEKNMDNYSRLMKTKTGQGSHVDPKKKKQYLDNLYNIFGLLRNASHMAVDFTKTTLTLCDLSINVMKKD